MQGGGAEAALGPAVNRKNMSTEIIVYIQYFVREYFVCFVLCFPTQ